jgi:hypothetical protein
VGSLLVQGHHEISHHQDLQDNYDKLTEIGRWEVEQFAYLLGKLDAIDEGNGITALDTSAVFFSSEIEDGNAHRHTNLPVLVGGSLGGTFKTGQHVIVPDQTPMANLFVSMLQGIGAPIDKFGDNSTGPLVGI